MLFFLSFSPCTMALLYGSRLRAPPQAPAQAPWPSISSSPSTFCSFPPFIPSIARRASHRTPPSPQPELQEPFPTHDFFLLESHAQSLYEHEEHAAAVMRVNLRETFSFLGGWLQRLNARALILVNAPRRPSGNEELSLKITLQEFAAPGSASVLHLAEAVSGGIDATTNEGAKERAVRYLWRGRRHFSPVVKVPAWIIPALALTGAFAAGLALASWRLTSSNAGFQSSLSEVHVETKMADSTERLLGHFYAEEARPSDLKAVLADHSVMLRASAADAFLKMQDAARHDGVWLIPLSGFRSVQDQKSVFFDIKAERGQKLTERAKVSAPPGYSEHHTGYALDIGDRSAVWTHLEKEFEETRAFDWLKQNAAQFHFEMSFPVDNEYGIMYEPWHWRFVGDEHSLRTFFTRRNQQALN